MQWRMLFVRGLRAHQLVIKTIAMTTIKCKCVLSLHWGYAVGGIAKYVELIDHAQELAGIRIRTLCIVPRNRQTDEEGLRRLNAGIISVRSVLDLSWLWKIRPAIREIDPDCIMTHGFNGHFVALMARLLMRKNIPLIASYHGEYYAPTTAKKLLEPMYNGFINLYLRSFADAIVSVAHCGVDTLVKNGVNIDKIAVIHNGIVDIAPERDARQWLCGEWGVGEKDIVIVAASRLDPYKGVDCLIESFVLLASNYTDVRLVIVGSGPYEKQLRKNAECLRVEDRVTFAGMRDDVPRFLAAADIFVIPSFREAHSMGLLEAMRAGNAIVATNVGGNTESVRHDKEALVVPPADSAALAAAIERLIKDGELRKRLGDAARARFLTEFTAEITVARTARWFERVVG